MARKLFLVVFFLSPLGFFPFLREKPEEVPVRPKDHETKRTLSKEEQMALQCLAVLPGQPFPANLPWEPLRWVTQDETGTLRQSAPARLIVGSVLPGSLPMETLVTIAHDPAHRTNLSVRFLESCLTQYEQNVQGYKCMFLKRERIKGRLNNSEKIISHFREKPFSVHMEWKEGAGLCVKSMYVAGENKGNLLALPIARFLGIWEKPVDGPEATATSRFPITQFGVYIGAQRTLLSIHDAEKRGKLFLRYEGIEKVAKLGDRPCYKFDRWNYEPEEEDGLKSMIIYIDQETLLQTGSVLYNGKGELIAEYFFRDLELNPVFSATQFTRKSMD